MSQCFIGIPAGISTGASWLVHPQHLDINSERSIMFKCFRHSSVIPTEAFLETMCCLYPRLEYLERRTQLKPENHPQQNWNIKKSWFCWGKNDDYIMSDLRTTKSIWFQNFLCSPNGVMGKIYRNPLQLLIDTINSCRCSLKIKPIS